MNRFLPWFNLLGVVALALLCAVQWRANRAAHLALHRLERTEVRQAGQLAEQTKTVAGQADDLASLRQHAHRLAEELSRSTAQLAAAKQALHQSTSEVGQLKASVTNWAAAVAARDERLRQAASERRALAGERNAQVEKFNELAARHNKLVKDYHALQQRLATILTNTPSPSRPPP